MEENELIKQEAENAEEVNPISQTAEIAVPKSPENLNEIPPSNPTNSNDNFESVKRNESAKNIERLLDVEMNVTVRFGKTEIPLREAVSFGIGSMIELNRSVDEPVDLLVNNYPFARGEVVVIDGYYGVRITEIGTTEERSNTLLRNTNS